MEKIVEFPCPQSELLELILDLESMRKWPAGWHSYGPGWKNVRGYIEMEVGRQRLTQAGGRLGPPGERGHVNYFRRVGVLTIGKIGSQRSALIVRSEKPNLLKFLDDLTPIVTEHLALGHLVRSRREKPPVPPRGSSINVLFDYYHAVKDGGGYITLNHIGKLASLSLSAVKQAHVRYKLEGRIS